MKIVASNSLTVSNVNDGTITHTAWAYSADGTDRFTTTYPNLNLLKGSSAKTKDGFFKNFGKVENDYGEVTIKGTNTLFAIDLWDSFSIQPRDYKPNDKYTMSMDVMFTSWNFPAGTDVGEFWLGQRYTKNSWKNICTINLPHDPSQMLNQWIRITQTSTIPPYEDPSVGTQAIFQTRLTGTSEASFTIRVRKPKQEPGSIATPHMPSSSEVTNADWPSYIGQYSDFTSTVSTDPAKYAPWTIFKGNDGVGVKTTDITYAMSTSGTTAPSTGWTSSVPTIVKGQYFWTKTAWTYTDNSSKTGYSVTYISKDGTNGTDGTSGIIVSSVAPSSPQIGQLWQDTSTTPQLVKKWTGSEWVIWKMYVENMVVDTISSMSSDLGDVSAGTVKLMADVAVNDTFKKHGLYQSKLGLLSSGPSLSTPSTFSNSQMGVANLNKGELRFIVTDYTEDLKTVQESGISDPNAAFIRFSSYDNGKDVMLISSSGDIVFNGITSQDTPWISMGNGAYYKNMFSRVYISYSVKATSTADIPLGVLPVGLRPFRGLHLTANAWAATLVNDRHIEVRTTGEVMLYNPANGASYDGEVSFTL